ncbi:hypothetical protein V8C35DRAFT_325567 [Trichoderma chlorosporum]
MYISRDEKAQFHYSKSGWRLGDSILKRLWGLPNIQHLPSEVRCMRLSIIVEPDCSVESWLKFSVSLVRGSGPTWKVGNLDDVLAQPLRYLRPREIFIDFQSPKKGHYKMCFLILRAKLFDVCAALDLVQPQKERSLYLHFGDPWANTLDGPAKPFWENRPPACYVKKDSIRRMRHPDFTRLVKNAGEIEKRGGFMYFYEMILTPFCLHWAWRNAKVTFDREPKLKSTSFIAPDADDDQRTVYHGVKALLLTAWAYTEQLMQEGLMSGFEEEDVPEFGNQEAIRTEWASRRLHHRSWKRSLECYLNFAIGTMPQTAKLPEKIWRNMSKSPRNAFSEVNPGSDAGAGNEGLEVGTWTWNHDIVRRRYQDWAELWNDSRNLLDPIGVDMFDLFYSIDSPGLLMDELLTGDFETVLESHGLGWLLLHEIFRAYHLRHIWPLRWRWQCQSRWIITGS